MGDSSSSNRTHEDVARLAYERYLTRGQEHGSDVDDWLAAEQEVQRRHAAVPPHDEAAATVPAEVAAAVQATAIGPAAPRRRSRDRPTAPPASDATAAPRVRM